MGTKLRYIIIFTGLILFLFICKLSNAQNLIAYYPFDNSATDHSSYLNHGQINGTVSATSDRFGNACSALLFDGSSGFIEVPSSPSLESIKDGLTIAVWYKLTLINTDNYWLTVLCKGISQTELLNNPQYRLQIQQNKSVEINTCSPSLPLMSSTISLATKFTICDPDFYTHLFQPDEWHFYALTYNGNVVKTFMDGIEIFEYPYSLPLMLNNSPLFIAKDEPGAIEYFNGALDELRIFNKALSQSEIDKLFNESTRSKINSEEFELEILKNKTVTVSVNSCNAKVIFNQPKIDSHCGNVSLTQVAGLPSGSIFERGKHLITYLAKSTSGYEQACSFYIIVNDVIPPSLIVPSNEIILCNKGEKGVKVNYVNPTASDNCKIKNISLVSGLPSGSFFPLGKNNITYIAVDESDNKTIKSFYIQIKEKIEPVVVSNLTPTKPDTISYTKPDTILYSLPTPIPIITIDSIVGSKIEKSYKERLITTEHIINVESDKLLIELYDNGEIDGDSVSLFLNNKILVTHQLLALKPVTLQIQIDSTIDNELALFAENLGSIPPNTALLILYDGNKRHEINLTSDMKTNGVIIIRKKKKK